ncbi:hypothetical protein IT418_03210 [bacterium]|nr:hypothetical protein [bacterium]
MLTSISLFMVKELALWVVVAAVTAGVWVVPLIDLLYKLQFTIKHIALPNKLNAEWMRIHAKDSGTPTNGGILIWLTVPAVLLVAFWHIPLMKAAALIMLLVGLYGLADAIIDMVTRNNVNFREFQNRFEWRVGKLLVSIVVSVGVALLIVNTAGVKSFDFFGQTIHIDNFIGIGVLAVFSTFFSYATEIIDGIDGLSAGMYLITLVGFVLLMLAFPANFFTSSNTTAIAIVGALAGTTLVYLYFNIPPARFYMGAPGAMLFGPVFLLLGLYGNIVPALLVLMLPYFIDLATSFIQLISLRFFQKKVFRIAPIHHHFEALGWPSPKVVMRFWLVNAFVVILAVLVQVFL